MRDEVVEKFAGFVALAVELGEIRRQEAEVLQRLLPLVLELREEGVQREKLARVLAGQVGLKMTGARKWLQRLEERESGDSS